MFPGPQVVEAKLLGAMGGFLGLGPRENLIPRLEPKTHRHNVTLGNVKPSKANDQCRISSRGTEAGPSEIEVVDSH
jgi:hypothetical protein